MDEFRKTKASDHGRMSYNAQILGSLGVCISFFILGNIIGFPTIALPLLMKNQNESNNINFLYQNESTDRNIVGTSLLDNTVYLNEEEASAFVYLYPLTGMVMCTIGGMLSGKYGRRTIILTSAPLIGIGWLLIGLAQEKIMLFCGRLIVSIFALLYTSSVGAYVSETVHPSLRASLVVVSPILLSLGYLMVWGLSCVIKWRMICFMSLVPCIFLNITMMILPETPYWLIENNRFDKARESLVFFRGSLYDVNPELDEIHKRHLLKDKSQACSWILQRLFSKAFFQPFLCSGVLYMIFCISGFSVIIIYMVTILEETGSGLDPKNGPVIVGSVRAALSCLGPFVITIIPPKILFTTAQLISASCISILGVFAYWNNYYTIDSGLAWIPLAAIILIFITRAVGTMPVMQSLFTEAYPTEIRTQAMSLTETMFLGLESLNLKLYPYMKNTIGFHGACCFYATMSFICAFWGLATIPDNRGKSLVKVEEFYEKQGKKCSDDEV